MINGRASPYECIGIKLYTSRDLYSKEQYTGKGLIISAEMELSSARVTTERHPEKTIELIINSTGLTKAERKIKRRLISERITIPQNLRNLMTSYKKEQQTESKKE